MCACCRVISRAPGLKLVVETLITSLRPIGNIVLICCAFFIVFGILGVQVNVHADRSPFVLCQLKISSIIFPPRQQNTKHVKLIFTQFDMTEH